MSIRSLSIPDKKLSVVIYAKTTNVQSATSSELTSEVADITTINCENVSTNNIYATSINELDLSLDLMPTSIGAPNQVLSRAPNFNPEDPETFKTVWQTVGGGGGNVNNPMTEDLNANNNKITNLSEITGVEGVLKTSLIDVQNNDIYHVNELKGRSDDNKLYISGNVEILENLNMTEKNINNCNAIETRTLTSIASFISCLKVLNMYAPIDMRDNSIFNADKLTGRYLGVDLNLDMIPATQGVASQVLARSPVYDPNNPATYKLVWQTPSGGGSGVSNPMTSNLNANNYFITNINVAEIKAVKATTISPIAGSVVNADCNMTFTANKEIKVALLTSTTTTATTVEATTIKPTTISPLTGTVVTADCSMTFTANKQLKVPLLTSDGLTALDSQLILIGRNQINNPVPVSISASDIFFNNQFDTSPLPKTTVHLNGTLTVDSIIPYNNSTLLTLTSPTILLDAPQTITTGDIVLQEDKKMVATRMNTNYIGSRTNTPLTIMALTDDAKNQTSIRMASPIIQLDNPNGAVNESQIYMSGNLTFNNPVSNPYITGRNLYIYSRTGNTPNVNTPLNITSSTCTITQETLNLSSSISNNITGTTNFNKNINLMSARGANISPYMVLYRTFGASSGPFDIKSSTAFTTVTLGQVAQSRGSKTIPVGGLVVGDMYKFTLRGYMSTSAGGNSVFYINFGTNLASSFTFANNGISNVYFEFSALLSVRDNGGGTFGVFEGMGKLERSNLNTLLIDANPESAVTNVSQDINISIKQSSTLAVGSMTIYNYIIENI